MRALLLNRVKKIKILRYLNLSSSGILRSVGWFRTDVSGLRIGPIFKGQYVQILFSFLDILTLEDGTDT